MADDSKMPGDGALARYKDDYEKVAEALMLPGDPKLRESLTGLLGKLAKENAAAGLVALGFPVTTGGVGGVAAGLAVKLVSAKFEAWLKEHDATANFLKKAAETQSDADRRVLLRDIRLWLGPTLDNVISKLSDHAEVLAELKEDVEALFSVIVQRLPEPPADTLAGVLRARTLALPPLPAERSPAQLLDARYGVVPFDVEARANELSQLRAFCDDPTLERLEVRLFYGTGGVGKSRLLMHFCQELWGRTQDVWHAGFLEEAMQDNALPALTARGYPALVVIDYAEGRRLHRWLKSLLEAEPGRAKIRIVLLARHADEWWANLAEGDAAVERFRRHSPMRLRDVSYDPGDRSRMFAKAKQAYASALHRSTPNNSARVLREPHYARPLYLSMAALFDVLDPDSAQTHTATELTWFFVCREHRLWRAGLTESHKNAEDWGMLRLMAAVTLLGGVTLEKLDTLAVVSKCPVDDVLSGRLMSYHPRDHGVGPLEPDLLGEALVAQVLGHKRTRSTFLDDVLGNASTRQVQQALTVLGRIGTGQPAEARKWVGQVLRSNTLDRATPALDATLAVAVSGVDDVIGQELAAALQTRPNVELARAWESRLPELTVSLREVKVWVYEQLKAAADDDEVVARYATNLGIAYSSVGRREDALQASDEAVAIHRKLASSRPGEFLRGLAISLQGLSHARRALGDFLGGAKAKVRKKRIGSRLRQFAIRARRLAGGLQSVLATTQRAVRNSEAVEA